MTQHDCVFCRIIAGVIPSAKVYESANVIAFLDINPIEKGHVLVVPKIHWPTISDISVSDHRSIECAEELMYIVRVVAKAVLQTFGDGLNILQANGDCAGQTVPHLHFHVIPRYGREAVQPTWVSGAGKYDRDEERDSYAARISAAVKELVRGEDIIE